ncbi:uncharacterized protein K441DRAFT_656011 [Cenococcum geophilum 1.58]|uniref:uncharacterized protein n=1 Tax=Cenococcum geophilum 1.58 TaxID=794803 RepID=UPI00358E5F9D|nr:hypothetical protein K441DRAFT_656011 [Cenococcum geophilum 1.58]
MHEPGHCLGLNHGGDQVNAADTFNNKPNYLSIMNYNFSVNGLQRNGIIGIVDYSGQALPSLNPTSLNEPAGLGPLAALQGTVHWSASRGTRIPVVDASPTTSPATTTTLFSTDTTIGPTSNSGEDFLEHWEGQVPQPHSAIWELRKSL